jgi:hypothetical protein
MAIARIAPPLTKRWGKHKITKVFSCLFQIPCG